MKPSIMVIVILSLVAVLLIGCRNAPTKMDVPSTCTNGIAPTSIEQDFQFPGTLLIYDTSQSTILAFDGHKHEFTILMELSGIEDYNVSPLSPDGKWLVISQYNLSVSNEIELFLLSNNGRIEVTAQAGKETKGGQ